MSENTCHKCGAKDGRTKLGALYCIGCALVSGYVNKVIRP